MLADIAFSVSFDAVSGKVQVSFVSLTSGLSQTVFLSEALAERLSCGLDQALLESGYYGRREQVVLAEWADDLSDPMERGA